MKRRAQKLLELAVQLLASAPKSCSPGRCGRARRRAPPRRCPERHRAPWAQMPEWRRSFSASSSSPCQPPPAPRRRQWRAAGTLLFEESTPLLVALKTTAGSPARCSHARSSPSPPLAAFELAAEHREMARPPAAEASWRCWCESPCCGCERACRPHRIRAATQRRRRRPLQ